MVCDWTSFNCLKVENVHLLGVQRSGAETEVIFPKSRWCQWILKQKVEHLAFIVVKPLNNVKYAINWPNFVAWSIKSYHSNTSDNLCRCYSFLATHRVANTRRRWWSLLMPTRTHSGAPVTRPTFLRPPSSTFARDWSAQATIDWSNSTHYPCMQKSSFVGRIQPLKDGVVGGSNMWSSPPPPNE